MSGLFVCEEPNIWRKVYDKYWNVVEAKAQGKKHGNLLKLDKWYQEELPVQISSRAEKHITLAELVKLMQWKLTRGKFRPRLQQLVASNSEDTVEKCSRNAFNLLPDVQAAIAELSFLKGVGPATASAVLAAGAPEQTAFMSDEAMESVPGLPPNQYTAKNYTVFLSKIVERSKKLNKADPQQDWTPHRVELCLWAMTTATKQQFRLFEELNMKNVNTHEKTSDIDSEHIAKKLKTA
uniref:Zgc:112496 n=1 Tax=Oryzias sinensis TaxID=183150 RepID=A0A8C7XQ96_9TELE